MNSWTIFPFFVIVSMICWTTASVMAFFPSKTVYARRVYLLGCIVYTLFLTLFWIFVKQPPFRTMGETRLWYVFFITTLSLILFWKSGVRAVLLSSTIFALLFSLLNIFSPEMHFSELPEAFQGVWFIPHVSVYMCAYSFLSITFVCAILSLCVKRDQYAHIIDRTLSVGTTLLLIGLLLGMLWAKEAWGRFWQFDVKECWAMTTWLAYFFTFRYRRLYPTRYKTKSVFLIISFLILQMCWWGVKLLPSAFSSPHVY